MKESSEKSMRPLGRHLHVFEAVEANSSAFFCKSVWRLEDLTPAGVKRQHPGANCALFTYFSDVASSMFLSLLYYSNPFCHSFSSSKSDP